MYKILLLLNQFLFSFSQIANIDNHNCNVDKGYIWCDTSEKCIYPEYEPCLPITRECFECIVLHHGDDNNCGMGCSITLIEGLNKNDFTGTDKNGCKIDSMVEWCDILNTCISSNDNICPEEDNLNCDDIDCPIFCENGYQINKFGCQTCECNDNIITNDCHLEAQLCDGKYYVCPVLREITYCSTGGISGYTTYELSLQVINNDIYNIYALFGDSSDNLNGGSSMIIPAAYQQSNIFNSNIGGIPGDFIMIDPNLRYDSWLTIGLINGDPEHKISSIGVDFTEWNMDNELTIHNGAIFLLDPTERTNVMPDNYIIGQLTIPNDQVKQSIFNIQGKRNDDSTWIERQVIFNLRNIIEGLPGH